MLEREGYRWKVVGGEEAGRAVEQVVMEVPGPVWRSGACHMLNTGGMSDDERRFVLRAARAVMTPR